MKAVKRILGIATLLSALSGPLSAYAESLETIVGHQSIVLDTKVSTALVDGEKADLDLSAREKVTISEFGSGADLEVDASVRGYVRVSF